MGLCADQDKIFSFQKSKRSAIPIGRNKAFMIWQRIAMPLAE
jgi:hypothetical protein